MNNWLDAYEIKARLVPAALCALPAIVLYHYLLQIRLGGFLIELGHVRLLGYITVEAAVTYAFMQLNNRLIGKQLQSLVFRSGHMPTTEMLMPKDKTLSAQTKRDIRAKFKTDFDKDLPIFEQRLTASERRMRITELTAYIRQSTRDDTLVRNHNIEYGFVRNFCGGSCLAALVCAASVTIFGLIVWNKTALEVSTFLFIIYGLVAALSKPLIVYFGRNYAKVLFEQYLTAEPPARINQAPIGS